MCYESTRQKYKNSYCFEDALKRMAIAYEMVAIEGMKDFINHTDNDELSDQFMF
jgi:hypothetical protein